MKALLDFFRGFLFLDQRKKLIINKNLQYSLIIHYVLVVMIGFFIIFSALTLWHKLQYRQGFVMGIPSHEQIINWAQENGIAKETALTIILDMPDTPTYTFFDITWKPILIIMSACLVFIVFYSAFYTNRIAGPIYNIVSKLQKKVSGDKITPIVLRKRDAFQNLADLINQALKLKKGRQ